MNDRQNDEPISTADLAGTSTMTRPADRMQDEHEDDAAGTELAVEAEEGEAPAPLFPSDRGDEYRDRWRAVQTGFVDDPRNAVEEADGLVAQVIKELAQTFADERSGLEQQWARGEDVSTEDLRVALRRYRSFFDRLLSV